MKFWLDRGDSIFLYQLLKAAGVENDYTRIKYIIDRGFVQVNGENVFSQRYEVKNGDVVTYKQRVVEGEEITFVMHHIKVLDRRQENLPASEKAIGNVRHGKMKAWKAKPLTSELELDKSIEQTTLKIHASLQNKKLTLALAESCTGGMVQEVITRHSGCSVYFLGGIVSYSNGIKQDVLGVPGEILEQHGAVSMETAEAMAAGCKKLFGCDIAGAVTGIAGPDGGSEEKPVGTVHFAIAVEDKVISRMVELSGDRESIRKQATLRLLRFIASRC